MLRVEGGENGKKTTQAGDGGGGFSGDHRGWWRELNIRRK